MEKKKKKKKRARSLATVEKKKRARSLGRIIHCTTNCSPHKLSKAPFAVWLRRTETNQLT